MSKFTLTIEVGGDDKRLRRAAEEVMELIEDAGYLVTDYDVLEAGEYNH